MEIGLLERQAIKAAMVGAWDQAIELNQKILKIDPQNIPALNRLGRALAEKGCLQLAQKTYRRVLSIDRYNLIAKRNLKRLADQKKTKETAPPVKTSTPGAVFIEEPGKTKTVKLVRLATPAVLSRLNSADEVCLIPKKHTISVTHSDGTYLGALPDDLSHRLLRFIRGGNQYQAFVKTVDRQTLEIFIRETKRASRFRNTPSFTSPLISASSFRRG